MSEECPAPCDGQKQCDWCNRAMPLTAFGKNAATPDGLSPICKECRTPAKFGISLNQYKEMLAVQGGVCAICGSPPGRRALNVDHDHATGKIRGFLCDHCNVALGCFEDDIQRLYNVISYLRCHSCEMGWEHSAA